MLNLILTTKKFNGHEFKINHYIVEKNLDPNYVDPLKVEDTVNGYAEANNIGNDMEYIMGYEVVDSPFWEICN